MSTFLKFQDNIVLEFDFENNLYTVYEPSFLPYILKERIQDSAQMTGLSFDEHFQKLSSNKDAMMEFFMGRCIDMGRSHAKQIMNTLGLPQQIDWVTSLRIMSLCKGLSASDDFWLTSDKEENWDKVCLRKNPLHETLAHVALFGDTTISITEEIQTPELTTRGKYPKTWKRENRTLFLQKGAMNDRAAEQEVCTSNLLDSTNVPHAHYWLDHTEGMTISVCESMCNDSLSVVPAHDFIRWCQNTSRDAFHEIAKIDSEGFYKMLVTDYLIANPDRHAKNWGFYMDSGSGKLISLHPLFDHNRSFDKAAVSHPEGGYSMIFPKKTQLEAAKDAMNHCDFQFISKISESCFLEDYQTELFKDRCRNLGLNPEINRWE